MLIEQVLGRASRKTADLLTFEAYVLPLSTMFNLAVQSALRLRRRRQITGLVNGVV
jgi:hypothetical protein